ncbi:hypothetical protein GOBAR_AA06713 [Gossypium barbadense]|uniref:Uncharacterized protein n=1 Tax=Gossypium barbadense TaxID=3634 RepID=A0A2P5YE95_GOSBA|nr:hypothetical protein GOBAR_AA06713 [Gossypium barbadense]
MEIITGVASNLIDSVVICHYRRMVSSFEKKVKMLKDKRDEVLLDVDAAEKNGKNIYPKVNSWLAKADKMIYSELKEVKGLEDEANNKCFFGFCPNFKARYQLSKKAEEDINVVDELLQQDGFEKVSYRDVLLPLVIDFDSRKLIFKKIMEAVKDPNVNIIGVHEMLGVGKNTLVIEVVRQLFESVVMAVVTHTPDVQKIQDQIVDMLRLKFKEQSVTRRASQLCQRLKKEKNILVVLDDIWEKLDLMERCTILLTFRDLNFVLLKDMDAKKSFPIGVLEHEEAWHYFNMIIEDGVESSDLLLIATKVAKKCGGLPIAIRTLASSLRNEPPCVWEDALRQLSKQSLRTFTGVPAAIYSTIEWSYYHLQSEDHKQTFLPCGLMGQNELGLFHGVSTIKKTRDKLLTVVRHLKASYLLLDGNTSMQFDIHDRISDMAKSITSKDDETMKECNKIVCASMSELPDKLKCPKLTFLSMVSKDHWIKIPISSFLRKRKIFKVLFLASMNLSSLPSSISLLGSLGVLCLINCVLGAIALIGELKNLEILIITRQLTKLKELDLRSCSKLKRNPLGVLCKLSSISVFIFIKKEKQMNACLGPKQRIQMVEKLGLASKQVLVCKYCFLSSISIDKIWIPQAFWSTQNLTSLIIEGCENLKHDPKKFKNKALIRFPLLNFLKLKGLQKLIRFRHEDYTIKFLALMRLEIENFPKLKGFIHNSMRKDISTQGFLFNNKMLFQCSNAKRIWYNQIHTNSFSMLKELTIKKCDVLLNIFPPFLLGEILKKLIVTDCALLEEVFQIQVQREVNLVCLPKLKHYANLQQVCIQYLSYLTCFYPGMHRTTWTTLNELRIYGCERIQTFGHEESQI